MRHSSGTLVARPLWLTAVGAVVVAMTLIVAGSPREITLAADAPKTTTAIDPLSYVPVNAGVFGHLNVAMVWNSPLGQEIRKAAGKDLDKALAYVEMETGVRLETVETVTFYYPNMPQGPGDETTFNVIVTTNKPYDKVALLKEARLKDSEVKDGMIALEGKLFLHFLNEKSFVVLHEANIEAFKKGPLRDQKSGVMTEALKLAKENHHLVFSIDFSKLPNEIFTAAPPELEPFLPLLKSKSSTLFADLKDKELQLGLNFENANVNAAEESERSFKLLMKLAANGLAELMKSNEVKKEAAFLIPVLKELENTINGVKIVRKEARLEISATLKADKSIGKIVAEGVKKINEEASRSQATNNLRQIGLAMHNYHDQNNGFPAAAICDKKGKPLLSWRVSILPYIEQDALYKQFKLDEPWDSEHNMKLVKMMPRTYAIPGAKDDEGKTHFRVFHSNGAVFDPIQQSHIQDILDGTSNTLMVVEAAEAIVWTKPEDFEFDDKMEVEKKLRFVDGKTAAAFCDGSVRLLKKGLDNKTWHLLIQKSDGQVVPDLD